MRQTWVPSLGWEDPLEKGKAPVFLPGGFRGRCSLSGTQLSNAHPLFHRAGMPCLVTLLAAVDNAAMNILVQNYMDLCFQFCWVYKWNCGVIWLIVCLAF